MAAKKRKKQKKKSSGCFGSLLALLTVILLAIGAVYYFGSFEIRAKMERLLLGLIEGPRNNPSLPTPIADTLDLLNDQIPSSAGLIVEGGELGRDENSHFLAGLPQSRSPFQPLRNQNYTNLFNDRGLHTICIAARIEGSQVPSKPQAAEFRPDARVPKLSIKSMTSDQWRPRPIIPNLETDERYAHEASLATNLVPMSDAFFETVWRTAQKNFFARYPKRFSEVWVYAGPIYEAKVNRLPSGIPVPDAFFIVCLDLTDEGGLRALTLIIPSDATNLDLSGYISSISEIEKRTGLILLPELDYSARDTLSTHVSPQLW